MAWTSKHEGIEFREICLTHLQRILQLGSHELRDTTKHTYHPDHTSTEEQEDTRYSYIQAIENLAYVLVPHFDKRPNQDKKTIEQIYFECVKIINAFDFEILEWFKLEYKRVCDGAATKILPASFVLQMKLRYAKILFYELNKLLGRVDYLKKALYNEDSSSDNEVVEVSDDDDIGGEDEDLASVK